MNADNVLCFSSSCNFSLQPAKPKIPVLTVRREMYPFRFNDGPSKVHNGLVPPSKHSERTSLEVEIQFVRESDKSTVNTIRRRATIDQRLTLSDLPTQLLSELGCIIDPSLAQVEVFGLRLLDWSCLIPLDVVSEDLNSCTVGDKLSVLLNYLLFFFRVSIKNCHEITSVEVWSIIHDLVKRYTPQGAYLRLKQMNCPLLKTNSNALYDFLFQGGSINLESLDQMFQLSFLDIFSFDNWYRSFPIKQFLNGIKSLSNSLFVHNPVDTNIGTAAFEKLTSNLADVMRKNSSFDHHDSMDKSCEAIIQEAIIKLKSEPHSFALGSKTCVTDNQVSDITGDSVTLQKSSSDRNSFPTVQFKALEINQKQIIDDLKIEKRKVRNRVTFVVEDLKQLEEWFKDNPRPSREKFQSYATELNKRHQNCHNKAKRILHARNIVYWFKNARAAYKRMSGIGSIHEGQDLSMSEYESMTKVIRADATSINTEESNDVDNKIKNETNSKQDQIENLRTQQEDSEESMENVFLQHELDSLTDVKESTSQSSELERREDSNIEEDVLLHVTSQVSIEGTNLTGKDTPRDIPASYKGSKRRARIFLDPTSEVHRLEQWFQTEKYPDVIQIENFTNMLNMSPYRQNHFRKLVPENVTLWFKNRRARLKRCCSVLKADAD